MTTTQIARQFAATARDLQSRKITVDEARTRNAALRAEVGENAYDAGKRAAMVAIANGKA